MKKEKLLLFLLMACASAIYSQVRTVTGVVSEKGGGPLPGANVLVKGTSIGTSTDSSP